MKVKQFDSRGREYEFEIKDLYSHCLNTIGFSFSKEELKKKMRVAMSYGWNGTMFDMAFSIDKERALKDLVKSAMKLKELELHSDKCWKRVRSLEDALATHNDIRMGALKDAYEASRAVNEFWEELQENGMSDFMPEM
jgi:hypothetical protein